MKGTEGSDGGGWLITLTKACRSVRDAPGRVYNAEVLRSLPHIGPKLTKIVVDNLWHLYPPDEPDEDELLASGGGVKAKSDKQKEATK